MIPRWNPAPRLMQNQDGEAVIRAVVIAQITIPRRDDEATIRVDSTAGPTTTLHQREGAMIHVGWMPQMRPRHRNVTTTKADHAGEHCNEGTGIGTVTIMNDMGIIAATMLLAQYECKMRRAKMYFWYADGG